MEGSSLSTGMRTEGPTNREHPENVQWFDLSCPAVCSITAGIALLGMYWIWNPPPPYVLIIKDVLGTGLIVVGIFLAWKWCKGLPQKPELDEV